MEVCDKQNQHRESKGDNSGSMQQSAPNTASSRSERDRLYLATLNLSSLVVSLVLLIIPWNHPTASLGELTLWFHLPLILLEVSLLFLACYLVGVVVERYSRRMTTSISLGLHGFILLSILVNGMMYRWAGFGLWSPEGFAVLKRLPSQLIFFAKQATLSRLLGLCVCVLLYLCVAHATCSVLRKRSFLPRGHSFAFQPVSVACALILVSCTLTFRHVQPLVSEAPTRHPLAALFVSSTSERTFDKTQRDIRLSADASFHPAEDELVERIQRRSNQHRLLQVIPDDEHRDTEKKVLIVILESLRPELIDPTIMPWLAGKSSRGLFCSNHFSSGNASTHGVFSIVNGLDAYWYHYPVTHTPLLNRFFKQAGYEIGFFASQNDWRRFEMDGFIDSKHYDVFRSTPYRGIKSDRETLSAAQQFISKPRTDSGTPQKRLAVVYLYSTHAPYESYPQDQESRPFADDRVSYPYSETERDLVWNRYCNSARSIDRLLSTLDLKNTTVVITGDHGEAFLEDGTIGHGTKINRWQNRTPAIILGEGLAGSHPRSKIDFPTSHSDLLPTLLGACNIMITSPSHLDGIDLRRATDQELRERIVVTRDYLRKHLSLIAFGNHNLKRRSGITIEFDMRSGSFTVIGQYTNDGTDEMMDDAVYEDLILNQWLEQSFVR